MIEANPPSALALTPIDSAPVQARPLPATPPVSPDRPAGRTADQWHGPNARPSYDFTQGVVVMEAGDLEVETTYSPAQVAREDEFLPGSNVTGRPPHYSDPLQMLDSLGQDDALAITDGDGMRCGAACLMAAAIAEGPEAVMRVYQKLMRNPQVPEYLKAELREAMRNWQPSLGLTRRQAHLMQEALYQGLKAIEGTSGQDNGLRAETLASANRALFGTEGEGSTNKPHLQPGERRVVLLGPRHGGTVGHFVVVGRDAQGRYYTYNPGQANPSGGHAVRRYANAQQMWGALTHDRRLEWSMSTRRPPSTPGPARSQG